MKLTNKYKTITKAQDSEAVRFEPLVMLFWAEIMEQKMKFEEAIDWCHVRSAIYRTGDPTKTLTEEDIQKFAFPEIHKDDVGKRVRKLYWKNHTIPLKEQVPTEDQKHEDWAEYDPREDDNGSLFMFND